MFLQWCFFTKCAACFNTGADPGLAKGGRSMVSARSLNGGLGGGAPSGEPLVVGQGEAESFLYIFMQKKWPKVKDLHEDLPP